VAGRAMGPHSRSRIKVSRWQRTALPAPCRGVVVAVCSVVQPAPVCGGRDMLATGLFHAGEWVG
jgi:hypothetical protein